MTTKLNHNASTALDYGKVPPQAIDIEEVSLGALLIEGDSFEAVKTFIPAEAFYKEAHQKIYQAMHMINHSGGKIDILTVVNKLRDKGELESIGGAAYISTLTSRVGSAAHLKHHLSIIYEKWVARECIRIGSELVEQSYDADDILDTLQNTKNSMEKRLLKFLGASSFGVDMVEAGNAAIDEYFKREALVKNNQSPGIPTPFRALDRLTGGWQKEQLIILAARTSMGKTSLVISFLMTAALHGKSVAFFSMEMSSSKLMEKVLCNIADVDMGDFKGGRLTDPEKKKIEDASSVYGNFNVVFNEGTMNTMEKITATASAIKSKKGLDLVIIDYLQLMTSKEKNANRERQVAENSRKAKLLAVELDCTVILLSQLNRELEGRNDKKPRLSDLRESGAIEQDADMVLFIYRDEIYNKNGEEGIGDLLIRKNREGPTGQISFKYNKSMTRFCGKNEELEDMPF